MLRLAISACLCFVLAACGGNGTVGGGPPVAAPLFNVAGTNWTGTIQYTSPMSHTDSVAVELQTTNQEGTAFVGGILVTSFPAQSWPPTTTISGTVSGSNFTASVFQVATSPITCNATYTINGTIGLSTPFPGSVQLSASFNYMACDGTGPYIGTVTVTRPSPMSNVTGSDWTGMLFYTSPAQPAIPLTASLVANDPEGWSFAGEVDLGSPSESTITLAGTVEPQSSSALAATGVLVQPTCTSSIQFSNGFLGVGVVQLGFQYVACDGTGTHYGTILLSRTPPQFNVSGSDWAGTATILGSFPNPSFSCPLTANLQALNPEATMVGGLLQLACPIVSNLTISGVAIGSVLTAQTMASPSGCWPISGAPSSIYMATPSPGVLQLSGSMNYLDCFGTSHWIQVSMTRSSVGWTMLMVEPPSARDRQGTGVLRTYTGGVLVDGEAGEPRMEVVDSKNRELVGHLGLQELMLAPLAPGTKLRWRPLATGKEADLTVIAAW